MSGRRRDLLHRTHLQPFSEWLQAHGWTQEKPVGPYEVARFRHPNYRGPLYIYEQLDTREHYTIYGIGLTLAKRFLVERNAARAAAQTPARGQ